MIAIKKILVPTDFGEAADAALVYGRELASRFGATVHVLHVAENVYLKAFGAETFATVAPRLQAELEDAARKQLDEVVNAASSKSGPPIKAALMTSGTTPFAIVDYATENDIDLIVMGTHGRGPLAHMVMGSVAERVVRTAPCPVLTVRHPEHEFFSPVSVRAVAHA